MNQIYYFAQLLENWLETCPETSARLHYLKAL